MDNESRSIIQNTATIAHLLSRGGDAFWVLKKRSEGYKLIPGALYQTSESQYTFSIKIVSKELSLSLKNTLLTFLIHKNDCSIEFQAECKDTFQDLKGFHISIPPPESIIRLQRRQSYRVPVRIEGIFIPLKSTPPTLKAHPCLLIDLSLHGCLIVCKEKLNLGDKGHISLSLPLNNQTYSIESVIQRERDLREQTKSLYDFQYGIKFNYLDPELEKVLAKYINQLQIQYRQNQPKNDL